ncbi:cytochrome P450 [Irpex lacteus]|nr:cytochrome P450 [Irpex lacteus]
MSVTTACVAAAVLWVIWKTLREYIVPSALDKIPGPPRRSFWLGNMAVLFGREAWEFHDKLRAYGSVSKLHGILGSQSLFTSDPKVLQHVLVKDQQYFGEQSWLLAYNMACYGPGLLSVDGERHKKQRKMLNPAFSVAQMRRICSTLYKTAHILQEAIRSEVQGARQEVDVLSWLSRSALESIGRGGLGYSFDVFRAGKENEFAHALKVFIPALTKLVAVAPVAQYFGTLGSAQLRSHIMDYLPLRAVKQLNYAIGSMRYHSVKIYEEKKTAIMANLRDTVTTKANEREDDSDAILAALIRANAEAEAADALQDDELIAQMSTILFAATDTTSGMLSRLLHLLAQRPQVQEKLRAEVKDARDEHDIPYDKLIQLPYLDAVCKETLRMYPPTPTAFRQAQQDVVLPLSFPIRDINGKEQREILVPKGTVIVFDLAGANRHKAVWGDDADVWKPERWLTPLPDTVINAHMPGVYSHLMTFLGGSKSCIGFKFAAIEMKVILTVLLDRLKFSLTKEDIYWNSSLVTFPTVGKIDHEPRLPLGVEPLSEC